MALAGAEERRERMVGGDGSCCGDDTHTHHSSSQPAWQIRSTQPIASLLLTQTFPVNLNFPLQFLSSLWQVIVIYFIHGEKTVIK